MFLYEGVMLGRDLTRRLTSKGDPNVNEVYTVKSALAFARASERGQHQNQLHEFTGDGFSGEHISSG